MPICRNDQFGHSRSRRDFLQALSWGAAGAALGSACTPLLGQDKGQRLGQAADVQVLNPRNRVPLSFIIDDSTCLVNLAHFCIPQFADVQPRQYRQDWRKLPREIPDTFVREFSDWCRGKGVKGKYSIVPYPACVGRVDRVMPGWSNKALDASVALVRDELTPNWDIHPEMVTHTWVIDTKTGVPYSERSDRFVEIWEWTTGKSVDQIADYMSYALRILKNIGMPCEGITTPGGFGIRVLPELAQATLESCRDVYQAEIPHYFRHIFTDDQSVAPRVEYASGLDGADPRCVVSIVGCTGDWFGGWDGLSEGSTDRFITADLQRGRMVEVIERGEPAILVCHWPGIYYNGEKIGFNIFKEAVERLHSRYDNLLWMKLSEISRYWAARELTAITRQGSTVEFRAPFAAPDFTVRFTASAAGAPRVRAAGDVQTLRQVSRPGDLGPGTWHRENDQWTVCFSLSRGNSFMEVIS